jgi:hypothetical protein
MKNKSDIVVPTPGGNISVTTDHGTYPCVAVAVDGRIVSVVEWDDGRGKFQVILTSIDEDEPAGLFNPHTGVWVEGY